MNSSKFLTFRAKPLSLVQCLKEFFFQDTAGPLTTNIPDEAKKG